MHTQEPWKFDADSGTVFGGGDCYPENPPKMASLLPKSSPVVAFIRGYQGMEEAESNGFLISAAPDLKKVLEEAIIRGEWCGELDRMARAAIAKANGG